MVLEHEDGNWFQRSLITAGPCARGALEIGPAVEADTAAQILFGFSLFFCIFCIFFFYFFNLILIILYFWRWGMLGQPGSSAGLCLVPAGTQCSSEFCTKETNKRWV